MSSVKHRIGKLEARVKKRGLTRAEGTELARAMQGGALIPGKFPGHCDYKGGAEKKLDERSEPSDRIKYLLKKLVGE